MEVAHSNEPVLSWRGCWFTCLTQGGRQLDVLGAQAGQHHSCPVFLPTAPALNWALRSLGEKQSCLQASLPTPERASAPEKRGHIPGARGLHPWVLSQAEHRNQSPGRQADLWLRSRHFVPTCEVTSTFGCAFLLKCRHQVAQCAHPDSSAANLEKNK